MIKVLRNLLLLIFLNLCGCHVLILSKIEFYFISIIEILFQLNEKEELCFLKSKGRHLRLMQKGDDFKENTLSLSLIEYIIFINIII